MSRRYAQVIEVTGSEGELAVRSGPTAGPEQFLWRGRLHVVREVLAHWVEVGPWWHDLETAGAREREVWRVEAAVGRMALPGVYDLVRDAAGRWSLTRVYD